MKKMNSRIWKAIQTYQIPGCVNEEPKKSEVIQEGVGVEWSDHVPGTLILPRVGSIFLGMPKGFDRLGVFDGHNQERLKINIFDGWENFSECFTGYDKFNVPVWKYLDENGNTLIRGLSPRINRPFLHVILGDVRDKVDCLELVQDDVDGMD